MNTPEVSIIMRCKNSDWVIGSALAALFSQSFKDFELLVVDSGSSDKTLDIVKSYPCRLIQIRAEDYFPGPVLNDAITRCRAELIIFLNSDSVLLSPQSLKNLVTRLRDPKVSAVFGRQIPRPEAHTWVRREYAESFPEHESAPPWITLSFPLAGLKRSIWEKRQFYCDAWASEDTEWGYWATENGHKVVYEPTAITMHSHNYTLKALYGRRFVEGEADVFIYGVRDGLWSRATKLFKTIFRDVLEYVRVRDWLGIVSVVPRRCVYFWAYAQGQRLGHKRRAEACGNKTLGQRVVLESQ